MKLTRSTLLRVLAAFALVAVLGHRAWQQRGDATDAEATMAPIPPNAHEFRLGQLEFKACELPQKNSGATTSAFCTRFAVPEDRAQPAGRRIELRLALIASEAPVADASLVVLLAGGPGQAAVDTWPQTAGAFAPLLRHHHVLLLDQRGTGGSNALECKGVDEDQPATFDAARVREQTRECLAKVSTHADPRFYTTTDAVADLEAVRQALGAPRLDLVGISYGTRMAQQYARRHPDGVRSIVLDSVAPNPLALGQDFAANLDAALELQFAQCTADAACKAAFGDPMTSLRQLRAALREHPQKPVSRDPVTFAEHSEPLTALSLVGLVRMYAYTPETAAMLPLAIARGLKGDYTSLAGQQRLLTGDMSDLNANMMQLSVICSEDADLLAPRAQDADTMLGNHLVEGLKAACEVWPHGTRPADFHEPFKSDLPVLILAGEFDPVTPPSYAEQVLAHLGNARLLLAKGQGHNVIGRGCIPKLVGDFVDKLDPKGLDAQCIDQLGPLPAFVDFNGAAP